MEPFDFNGLNFSKLENLTLTTSRGFPTPYPSDNPRVPGDFRRLNGAIPLKAPYHAASNQSPLLTTCWRHFADAQPLGGPAFVQANGNIGTGHRGQAT